ncbi:MAG TPA: alpha/beta hydrolase [Ilumatobacteraceae bacterium]|nr:alpha/beta hydrolase [Ilumatobacteraceae bacterium]
MTETKRFKASGGIQLAGDAAGDPADPPVLLLHGGGQTRHSWGTTQSDLAGRGWYVVSLDLRGHGESDWDPHGDYLLESFAEDVAAVAAQFDRPALVGASLGGTSSLAATAIGGPEMARALVLVDVSPYIEPAGVQRIGEFMREHVETGFGSLDEVADAVAAYNPHRPRPKNLDGLKKNLRQRDGRWYWHWDPAFMIGRKGSTDETRVIEDGQRTGSINDALDQPAADGHNSKAHHINQLVDAAERLTIPTLLVRGKHSDLLSEEGAQKFLALVPHAKYVNVAEAGHMVAGDRNDLFNDAVVSFLTSLD